MIKTHTTFFVFQKSALSLIFLFGLFIGTLKAQFPPPAGQDGSTAIPVDSEDFVAWGMECMVTRGLQSLEDPDLGYADSGSDSLALGIADNQTISLGDGGQAILTFAKPIRNGAGWDFAVFENGFDDTFLELAFVEVSSDGLNFFRFPATSLTDTTANIGTFGLLDATKIDNLAGKYRLLQGTPFDLEQLADIPELDVEHITHVKIIDVVGSMDDAYASRDAQGNKINDPFPTPFPQSGFDLDAIGVRYEASADPVSVTEVDIFKHLKIYPNPVQIGEVLSIDTDIFVNGDIELELYHINGFFIKKINRPVIHTSELKAGIYILKAMKKNQVGVYKIVVN